MVDEFADLDARWLRSFQDRLRRWHAQHGRDLPWRDEADPYRVWISEIMLQQTTVAAVKPYFERFLQRFPTVALLAAATEDEVLRLWEGLGYYSRARNLRRAAQLVVQEHGGLFPTTVEELSRLPGIGRYTAGAIVSFAFDQPAPIVEANTLRLYCRLLGYRGDPRSTAGQRLLWACAEKLVPARQPGRFNQALMDLGATVCTPANPRCESCPAVNCCRARAENSQDKIPQRPQRPDVTEVHEASVVVRSRGRCLLVRRPVGARWAGLWDFPRWELPDSARSRQPAALEKRLADEFGLTVRMHERLTQLKHSVTRFRITLDCWQAELLGPRRVASDLVSQWIAPRDFGRFPFSVTGRQLADLIART